MNLSKNSAILALIVVGVISCFLGLLYSPFISLLFFAFFVMLLIARRMLKLERKFIGYLFISFIIGLVVVLVIYYGYISQYGSPYWMPGLDDYELEQDGIRAYDENYWRIVDLIHGSTNREKLHNCKFFVMLLCYFIRFGNYMGGYHTLAPRIFNIFLLILSGLLICSYLKQKFSNVKLSYVFFLITLFPNCLYLSSHIYRDTLVMFLIVFSFYLSNSLVTSKKHKALNLFLLLTIGYVTYWTRSFAILYVILAISFAFVFAVKKKNTRIISIAVASVVFIGACIVFRSNIIGMFEKVLDNSGGFVNESSRFVSKIYSMNLFPFGFILRTIVYLVSPYYATLYNVPVWVSDFYSLCQVAVSIGTLYLVSHYVFMAWACKKDGYLFVMCITVFASIVLTTLGYRHVLMLYPFLFALIGIGFSSLKSSKQNNVKMIGCCFSFLYFIAFGAVQLI